jgi:ParB-like chromosome segregation protein Spo0J
MKTKKAKKFPAHLRLEEWPVSRPIPYEQNARVHSEEQLEELGNLIEEFGQTKPVLVDEKDVVLAGHGTLASMVRKGHQTVIVRVIRDLSVEQKRAYRLDDNKIGLKSAWDEDLLKLEMKELQVAEFDLDLTAFSIPEIEAITVETKKVRREKTEKLEGEKGKRVRCPKCHHRFRVE